MQLEQLDFKDTGDLSIKTELLINLIRDRPHLWNTALSDYRDVAKCQKSWEEIGNLLDISPSMAKIEWRKLRDKFVRIKRLNKSSFEKYSANKWVHEERLTFLSNVIKHRGANSALNCPDFSNYSINYQEYDNSDQDLYEDAPSMVNKLDPSNNGVNNVHPESYDLEYSVNSGPPTRKRHLEDDDDSYRSTNQYKRLNDEEHHFGLHIAACLRNLSGKNKLKTRFEIQKLLFEAECNELDKND